MNISLNRSGKSLLRQFLLPPDALRITTSGSVSTVSLPSLLLEKYSPYTLERASFDDPSIPSGYYLSDSAKKALLAVDSR